MNFGSVLDLFGVEIKSCFISAVCKIKNESGLKPQPHNNIHEREKMVCNRS
jgi:hypothetical protein